MKICYIWVKEFRNFRNFGFNLSSSIKFNYNSDDNVIMIKHLDPLPLDFFGSNISDVVGLVGKNGAGKSNAIELICKMLKGAKTSLQTDFFLIVEENGEFNCYYAFQHIHPPKSNFPILFKEYKGSINPLKVVFFSNVFDERRNEFDKEVADISVNNLFGRGFFLRKNKVNDFEKQVKLINSKIFSSLNIDIPTKVQLISKVWMNRFNQTMEHDIYGDSYDNILQLKKILRDRLREIRPENKFVPLLRLGFFLETINKYNRKNRIHRKDRGVQFRNLNSFISNLLNLRTEDISEKLLEYLRTELSYLPDERAQLYFNREETRDYISEVEKTMKQIVFLNDLKLNLSNLQIDYNIEGSRNRSSEYFTIAYDSRDARNFLDDYITLFSDSAFFEINWLGISSGHKAYLNLFASLYQELRYTKHPNLILCIDEGDLYLHPMWQIEFFNKLLTILPMIFSGEIQLVLTSHSPFLLSDLPKQNITIFDKSLIGTSFDGIELIRNTFGGNLYNLYSEPFFLGQKRTSDFAYEKIKQLISLVENAQNLSEEKRLEYLSIANLVGDEIIQFKIKKLLKND